MPALSASQGNSTGSQQYSLCNITQLSTEKNQENYKSSHKRKQDLSAYYIFPSIISKCKFCRLGTNRLYVVPPPKKTILNSLFPVLNKRIQQLIERKKKKKKMLPLSTVFFLLFFFRFMICQSCYQELSMGQDGFSAVNIRLLL